MFAIKNCRFLFYYFENENGSGLFHFQKNGKKMNVTFKAFLNFCTYIFFCVWNEVLINLLLNTCFYVFVWRMWRQTLCVLRSTVRMSWCWKRLWAALETPPTDPLQSITSKFTNTPNVRIRQSCFKTYFKFKYHSLNFLTLKPLGTLWWMSKTYYLL